eukprot:scaffold1127_cov160-Amphora_coffeaeformis.AAC.11
MELSRTKSRVWVIVVSRIHVEGYREVEGPKRTRGCYSYNMTLNDLDGSQTHKAMTPIIHTSSFDDI